MISLVVWLRDIKKLASEQVLDKENIEQLKREFSYQLQTQIEQLPK